MTTMISNLNRNLVIKWTIITFFFLLTQYFDWRWRRIVHIGASIGWWGLVFFLVFILLPKIEEMSPRTQQEIIGLIIPRIFRAASILGFFSVGMGWRNALEISNGDHSYFTANFDNFLLMVGGILATGLYLFHLFLEHHEIEIAMRANTLTSMNMDDPEINDLVNKLKIIPRVGFIIMTFSALSMLIH
ncbi:MAG: hypothetical protein ACW97P_09460 [Candidatus Hodarchaeales archaeon]|jgi:hypothetical protein